MEVRPWGWMVKLLHTRRLWIKVLRVYGKTSLQSHENRTEYHFGFTKVAPKEKHRLLPGFYLEVSTGNPEEGDITRYDDEYGRL